jgi:hypothetical protein
MKCRLNTAYARYVKLAIVALFGASFACAQAATTWTFPSASAPCNTTLQACIDGAMAGDTVEVATNAPVTTPVELNKSLTLRGAIGFSPVLSSTAVTAAANDVAATISGLRFTDRILLTLSEGGGNLAVTIDSNTLVSNGFRSAITVTQGSGSGPFGRTMATITRNTISETVAGGASCSDAIDILTFTANFEAIVDDNVITMTDTIGCAAIQLYAAGGLVSTARVSRNRILGSNFNNGILARAIGSDDASQGGRLNVRIENNVIRGQRDYAGGPVAIAAFATGSNSLIDAQIVNNTVVGNDAGISVSGDRELGSFVRGGAYNNIIAFNLSRGLIIDREMVGFANSHNLLFDNPESPDGPSFTPGPGTRTGDPAFVNAAIDDYRLTQNSDALDRGLDSALPPGVAIDVAGNPRRQGRGIDIGAYESALARAPDAVPALGRGALAALAMLIGLLAIARGRHARSRR